MRLWYKKGHFSEVIRRGGKETSWSQTELYIKLQKLIGMRKYLKKRLKS